MLCFKLGLFVSVFRMEYLKCELISYFFVGVMLIQVRLKHDEFLMKCIAL